VLVPLVLGLPNPEGVGVLQGRLLVSGCWCIWCWCECRFILLEESGNIGGSGFGVVGVSRASEEGLGKMDWEGVVAMGAD